MQSHHFNYCLWNNFSLCLCNFIISNYHYSMHVYMCVISLQSGTLWSLILYSLGHADTCTHILMFLCTHTLAFTPSIPSANPHYPSMLTESFSSVGHRKGSPAAFTNTDMRKHTPPLLHSFPLHSLRFLLPVLIIPKSYLCVIL